MLRELTVRDLALIDRARVQFGAGLTVITGETGAGKSILVDALTLLAGGRGSADLVRSGSAKLTVTGEFDVGPATRAVLEDAGLPGGETVLVRREVAPDGRGRAYVDDEPAAVRTLARLGTTLVAIHGQNAELELAQAGSSLDLLDSFAGAEEERAEVARA